MLDIDHNGHRLEHPNMSRSREEDITSSSRPYVGASLHRGGLMLVFWPHSRTCPRTRVIDTLSPTMRLTRRPYPEIRDSDRILKEQGLCRHPYRQRRQTAGAPW
jgi:hypothetical protein